MDKLADQEDALTEMKHRLAHMAQVDAASATGGQQGEGSRLLGAFQKLRDRTSRPSSPPPVPLRRNHSNSGHVPDVPGPGTTGGAEALAAGWQLPSGGGGGGGQNVGSVAFEHGQVLGYGHARPVEDGSRDESKVSKWFNKLIRKDEWSDQAAG